MEQIKLWFLSIYASFSLVQLILYVVAFAVLILAAKISSMTIAIFSVLCSIYITKLIIEYLLKRYTLLNLK